jgi:hypothetical protein
VATATYLEKRDLGQKNLQRYNIILPKVRLCMNKTCGGGDDVDAEITPLQNVKVMPQQEAGAQKELRRGEKVGQATTATYLEKRDLGQKKEGLRAR